MGFLAHTFFIVLAVFGVVGAFVGFINPEKLKDKKTGKVPSRLKVLGMSSFLFFVGIVGASAMSETKTTEKPALNEDMKNLKQLKSQFEESMKDPRKIRYLECNGIEPYETKPSNWQSPTKSECSEIDKVLTDEAKARAQK